MLDVVLVAVVLEVQLLVTPEGGGGLGAGDEPSHESFLGAVLGRRVISEDFEHDGVLGDERKLILEVVLVSIGPPVDIVGLNIDLEGPVRLVFLLSKLVELGQLHHGHGTSVVGNLSQVLANGLTGAVIIHLSENVGPTVLEEVEGWLSIEGKHGEPVTGGHAVTETLDSVAWGGLGGLGSRLGELRDSHDAVLEASEAASVGAVRGGDELDLGCHASRVSPLDSTLRHGVTDVIERQIHVLFEKGSELRADKEAFRCSVLDHVRPDDLLLAESGEFLVVGSVEMSSVRHVRTWLGTVAIGIVALFSSVGGRGQESSAEDVAEFHLLKI